MLQLNDLKICKQKLKQTKVSQELPFQEPYLRIKFETTCRKTIEISVLTGGNGYH